MTKLRVVSSQGSPAPKQNDGLVEALVSLLERAKAGDVIGLIGLVQTADTAEILAECEENQVFIAALAEEVMRDMKLRALGWGGDE